MTCEFVSSWLLGEPETPAEAQRQCFIKESLARGQVKPGCTRYWEYQRTLILAS